MGTYLPIKIFMFGFIPLIPYFFIRSTTNSFLYSSAFTLLALFILGLINGKLSKQNYINAVMDVMIVGIIASSLAYIVGYLASNFLFKI